MSVTVLNHGCRLNLAEGEAIRLATTGLRDLTVINSCAVTAAATRQARQAVRRAHRERPGDAIIVTGCAATIEAEAFAAMPQVAGVVPNRHKRDAGTYRGNVPFLAPFTPVASGSDQTRAFIGIQDGCDHACTFCVITIARGDSVSASPADVVAAARAAVDRGQREVVLTGVDVTSYAGGLAALVATILREVPDLPRLRLSSLDPHDVDAALFDLLVTHERVMPSVHLSLQAGDDLTLKRMKRRHTHADAVRLIEALKAARPAISIGADLIAGFPTEDDAMFANTLAMIDKCDIVMAHVFPYSPRAGTAAARMPQVPPAIAKQRAATLRAAAAARRSRWLDAMIGSTQHVLVESDGNTGHAPNFARVRIGGSVPGAIVPVRITGRDGDVLTGVAA